MLNKQFFLNHQEEYFKLKKCQIFTRKDLKINNQKKNIETLPYNYSELYLKYNEEYSFKKNDFLDISFFVLDDNDLIAFIPLSISKDSNKFVISSQGQSIISPYFFVNDNRLNIFEYIYSYYLELMRICQINKLIIKENYNYIKKNYFNLFLLQKKLKVENSILGLIKLDYEISNIKSHFRKSYKSLVNKKYDDFTISELDKNDDIGWNDFKNFHLFIANKKTRSDKSWEIQLKMIKNRQGALFTIKDNKKLIGGTFVNLSKIDSYYSVAVFDRSYFPIPLGHILQFFIIKSLKNSNIKYYILGEFEKNINLTKKEENIISFKKGFCTNLENINNHIITN